MFTRQTVLTAVAASAALMGVVIEAFAPPPSAVRSIITKVSQTRLSVSAIDDMVAIEDEPADYLLSASDLDGDDDLASDVDPTPARFLSAARIAELRETYRRHPTDSGSPEFQVAGMTERISHLTMHLKEHPKDFSTRRGLVALVNKRRRLLNYLFSEDEQRYVDIVGALGIRHKVPGRVPTKEDKYGRFPLQKGGKKGKSKMNVAKKRT